MNGTLLFRTRLARPIASGLSIVLLALSVAAGFHREDPEDLGWLPERFHQHHFGWAAEAEAAKTPLLDHCLACHIGRMLVRLAPPTPALPDAPAPAFPGAARSEAEARTRSDFLSAPRAPPAS
jgi:hypothetical protein